MKRFRSHLADRGLTRRATLAGAGATLIGACGSSPAGAESGGGHPLWPVSGAPVLRGAVIAQRRRRLDVDGPSFGGGAPVLPRYQRSDFDRLAAAGANLVVMSFPELWTVAAPWKRDNAMADTLGRQLDDAKAAGLFVVLALRSGPGRSDFVFHRDAAGSWFPAQLIVDSIWRDRDAQAAWAEMCIDAARLVKDRTEMAGLNIMVEPEPNVGGLDKAGRHLGAWTPAEYQSQVSEVSDWNRISGDIARKVRAAAPDLPLLISPPAFARTDFLSVMGPAPVSNTIWCIHDYEPRAFTHHPEQSAGLIQFNQTDATRFALRLDAIARADAPIFLGEFGASRWAEGVDDYYRAFAAACEARGISWAAFRWPTQDGAYEKSDAMFNVLEPGRGVAAITALREGWSANVGRPGKAQLRGRS